MKLSELEKQSEFSRDLTSAFKDILKHFRTNKIKYEHTALLKAEPPQVILKFSRLESMSDCLDGPTCGSIDTTCNAIFKQHLKKYGVEEVWRHGHITGWRVDQMSDVVPDYLREFAHIITIVEADDGIGKRLILKWIM
jgi:hypothetical protein